MARRHVLTRREFMRASVMAGGAFALVACSPAPPIAPAPEPGKTAEPIKAGAPAPAATTATSPAGAAPEKLGKQLIGRLEGAEVITDPAKFPKSFKEAPMLAELVKAGKLPPVEKRLPEEPLVLKPLGEIGKYGGTWRRAFTGPADNAAGFRAASGTDFMIYFDYTAEKYLPNICKGWEVTDDGRTYTIHLREGMKWSDGQPLTAEDFRFWFEDILGNKELFPSLPPTMAINGKPGTFEKVDDYTIRYKFPEPYYTFIEAVIGGPNAPGGGQATRGYQLMAPYVPAHYCKQFHPKYVPQAELDQTVKDAKMDNWKLLILNKNSWHLNPDLPVVSPWKTVTPANTPIWKMERNPYSIWVDTDGNQLPYIDKMIMSLAENTELLNIRATAGEYDLQEMNIDLIKLPVYLDNQAKSNYTVRLDPADNGSDCSIRINNTFEGDAEIAKWFNNTDFRRALSLGIDRDQLNETFWLGMGVAGSPAPADHNKYSPGPEYRSKWHTYDPKQANEMLDKIGLDKKDAEGYRLRTDGKGRLRLEAIAVAAWLLPYAQMLEMVSQHWKKIGIILDVKELERSLAVTRFTANEHQMGVWVNDGSEFLYAFPLHVFPDRPNCWFQATLWGTWFESGGKRGKEPPAPMKQIMEDYIRAQGVPEEEQIKLGKEIWRITLDEVYNIGIVGLSPAVNGVRIVKNNMGNVPERLVNSPKTWNSASRPVTYYFKN